MWNQPRGSVCLGDSVASEDNSSCRHLPVSRICCPSAPDKWAGRLVTLFPADERPFLPEKYVLALELIVSMVLRFPPSWDALHPADTLDVSVIGSRVTGRTHLSVYM